MFRGCELSTPQVSPRRGGPAGPWRPSRNGLTLKRTTRWEAPGPSIGRHPAGSQRPRVILGSASVLVVAAHLMTATGSTSAETITFNMRDGHVPVHNDIPPKGEVPGAGDSFVVTNPLFKGGDRIGTLHAECTVTRRTADPDNVPFLCGGIYRLQGGQISGDTSFKGDTRVIKVAITGGTGDYAGRQRRGPRGADRAGFRARRSPWSRGGSRLGDVAAQLLEPRLGVAVRRGAPLAARRATRRPRPSARWASPTA